MDFIRITKRSDLPRSKEIIITILAVAMSIVFAGIILAVFGLNPFEIFREIIMGSVGTEMRIKQTIVKAVPLIITSMGIIVAFKMKFWNIGAEGQITMGALGAAWVAINLHGTLPQPALLLLMMAAAAICGGIWAFIPAVFKAKLGTNETIFTLMLNYVAIKFVTYLQYGPWRDPGAKGFPRIETFSQDAVLPSLGGVHTGWIIAVLATVFVYFFMKSTKLGYEIAVVGESIETARYAGMNISKIIIAAMLISGGLCGITGMIQASAVEKTLVYGIANNYGFTAIITAWLSKLKAGYALLVCVAFAMLMQGGDYIQIAMGVSSTVSDIVQGLILFFILGSEFFLRYKVHLGRAVEKEVA
ncbi:MAG TPA: ABC transporter permease [Candidatus Copromorpha excrementigallinarum]|uniref:ABC transporter permease n=1 Tax=Candidatus Allocopromorpha excrementigallinarum TaxID=2840742 RepID=A0A9D1I271_9FIRM|nr:ABC transporter permease [Candidatus Copromorpha excrementigallinarum]